MNLSIFLMPHLMQTYRLFSIFSYNSLSSDLRPTYMQPTQISLKSMYGRAGADAWSRHESIRASRQASKRPLSVVVGECD